MAMVRACLAMLPRLSAQESLTEALRVAVGSGALPKELLDETHQQWSATAFGTPAKTTAPLRAKPDPERASRASRAFDRMNRKHSQAEAARG